MPVQFKSFSQKKTSAHLCKRQTALGPSWIVQSHDIEISSENRSSLSLQKPRLACERTEPIKTDFTQIYPLFSVWRIIAKQTKYKLEPMVGNSEIPHHTSPKSTKTTCLRGTVFAIGKAAAVSDHITRKTDREKGSIRDGCGRGKEHGYDRLTHKRQVHHNSDI